MPLSTPSSTDDFDEYLSPISTTPFPNLNAFRHAQQEGPSLQALITQANLGDTASNFALREDLLYKRNYSPDGARWLLVVPQSLQTAILQAMRDEPTSDHAGFSRTFSRVSQRFYWLGRRRSVRNYVAQCIPCQRYKCTTTSPSGLLQPILPPHRPFETVGVDLIGPFPKSSAGNRWIIVCVDHLTRNTETMALPSATAIDVANFLLTHIVLRHGPPRVIISDRGRQFVADTLEELVDLCGSQQRHATSYHPQTNGLTQGTNRTLCNMLSMYVDSRPKNWDDILPFITYAYNTGKQETTGYSPFNLVYARSPSAFLDTFLPYVPHCDDHISDIICRAEETRRISRL